MKIISKEDFLKDIGSVNRYSLLDRMRSDCEYVIHNCGCAPDAFHYLWGIQPEKHIAYMRYLWESLEEKPEWLTMEKIDEYEKRLILKNPRYQPRTCANCAHYDGRYCTADLNNLDYGNMVYRDNYYRRAGDTCERYEAFEGVSE